MEIDLKQIRPEQIACDALIVGIVEGGEGQPPPTVALNRTMGGAIGERLQAGDLRGTLGEVAALPPGAGVRARRVLSTGLGKAASLTPETLRIATGKAVAWLEEHDGGHAATLLHAGLGRAGDPELVAAVVESAELAAFRPPRFGERVEEDRRRATLERLTLIESRAVRPVLKRVAHRAQVTAEAANHARRLGELPSNLLTPRRFAEEARRLLRGTGVKLTIRDERWIREHRMGGLLGVAQGSKEPPRFLVMEHRPRGARRHVALVGKGVTFDTGGVSLKPSEKMDEMKYDMCGAAAVTGTMIAAGRLGAAARVTGLVPLAENMPGGAAIKPGDVLITMAGKSIEVINTDAEGRLLLADGIEYGRRLEPDAIIDLATLTGACVVALGHAISGLMGTDEGLIADLRAAGDQSGERAWPLPLLPEYDKMVKSDLSDLRNSAGREAGALTAGAFLKPFAGSVPWAHLDIAGVAWGGEERSYLRKGATGFGVRLLCAYLGLRG